MVQSMVLIVIPQAAGFVASRVRLRGKRRLWVWPAVSALTLAIGWLVCWDMTVGRAIVRAGWVCGNALLALSDPILWFAPASAVVGLVLQAGLSVLERRWTAARAE